LAERTYLSIGDVLSLLKGEFPDITISKIRFLESQGLLDPERTPSGYRKFYEEDVDRLRWILRQQRENFLPLKVIKGRLGGNGGNGGNGGTSAHSESERGAGVGAGVTAARSSMGATLRRGEGDLPGSPAEGAPQDPLAEQLAPTAAGRAGSRHQGADDDRTARGHRHRPPGTTWESRRRRGRGVPAPPTHHRVRRVPLVHHRPDRRRRRRPREAGPSRPPAREAGPSRPPAREAGRSRQSAREAGPTRRPARGASPRAGQAGRDRRRRPRRTPAVRCRSACRG